MPKPLRPIVFIDRDVQIVEIFKPYVVNRLHPCYSGSIWLIRHGRTGQNWGLILTS